MKTVINKFTRKPLFITAIDVELAEDQELVDGILEIELDTIEVPLEVQLWKIRTVLKLTGLEEVLEQALNGLEEPMKTSALYIWQFGTSVDRYSPTIAFIQQVLQMTDEQIDEIFINANKIVL